MKTNLIFVLLFLGISGCQGPLQKEDSFMEKQTTPELYEVTHSVVFCERRPFSSFSSALNEQMMSRKIDLSEKGFFNLTNLEKGDRVLLNPKEVTTLEIKGYLSKAQPAVVFRKKENKHSFGFLLGEFEGGLQKRSSSLEGVPLSEILAMPASSMTVIYAIFPPDRKSLGSVFVKQKGRWIRDRKTGKIKIWKGIAQSRRHEQGLETQSRLLPKSDTPQGIYEIRGAMLCNHPGFGGIPRLDLDGSGIREPLKEIKRELTKPLLDQLLPPASHQEYWIYEWPLAFALGRYALRIHANAFDQKIHFYQGNAEFTQTSGCLNLGKEMTSFLETLRQIEVFDQTYNPQEVSLSSQPIQWTVSPRWKDRVFLVVKDDCQPIFGKI